MAAQECFTFLSPTEIEHKNQWLIFRTIIKSQLHYSIGIESCYCYCTCSSWTSIRLCFWLWI